MRATCLSAALCSGARGIGNWPCENLQVGAAYDVSALHDRHTEPLADGVNACVNKTAASHHRN